jgi:hypothetical protein
MINKSTYEMLEDLLRTNSPQEKLEIIKDFVINEGSDDQRAESKRLIELYKNEVDKRKEQGLQAVAQRKAKNKTKSYAKAKLFDDFKGPAQCTCCHQIIQNQPAYRHKMNGVYKTWHLLCFEGK